MPDKRFDVTAIGELLVDFTSNQTDCSDSMVFEAQPGGAPCNVLAMLQKLGKKTAFIGKVGNDLFGKMLGERIRAAGICIENLVYSSNEQTTLAFIRTATDGERSFVFYRNPGADTSLTSDDVSPSLISASKIFHYGSLSMTREPAAGATEYALATAKKAGCIMSFDPNLRMNLWDTAAHARDRIIYGLSWCSVLKIAEEELSFVTGKSEISEGIAVLRRTNEIPLITVTLGKKGSMVFYDNGSSLFSEFCPAFTTVKTIDTTGAGDTFCACILNDIIENGWGNFSSERLRSMLCFANAAAALVTTKKGALPGMPSADDIRQLIKKN